MNDEEPPVMDLREVMKHLETSGSIPEGFVMIYMLADPDESEDVYILIYIYSPSCKFIFPHV